MLGSGAQSIDLHGFDFSRSLSLSGDRTAAEVPHDFRAEEVWVETAARGDPRLVVHPPGISL